MAREDYIEVSERIQTFYEKYPEGSLQSEYELVTVLEHQWIIVKAYAYRSADDSRPGIGHAWEHVPGKTSFTLGSELMVGETSAWGRAIVALGISAHKGVASADEVRNAQGRQNAPVFERTKGKPAQDDPWETPPNAPTRTERITDMNVATSAQIGKIRGTLKDMGITSTDEARDLVNACLAAKGSQKQVTLVTELDKREASQVIEALLESVTVEQVAQAHSPKEL
jgi:hypothetical protein